MLKLSGEALAAGKGSGYDETTVRDVAQQVLASVKQGVEVGIVIGGGNYWRGRTSEAIDRTKADQIGMLATIMNCIYVSEIFRSEGMETAIFSPFACGTMTELFSKDRVNECFKQGKVVFFGGGTGTPHVQPASAQQGSEYVVVRGDCLWNIAQRILGPNASNATILEYTVRIHQNNRSTIGDNPDLVLPGQRILLPS